MCPNESQKLVNFWGLVCYDRLDGNLERSRLLLYVEVSSLYNSLMIAAICLCEVYVVVRPLMNLVGFGGFGTTWFWWFWNHLLVVIRTGWGPLVGFGTVLVVLESLGFGGFGTTCCIRLSWTRVVDFRPLDFGGFGTTWFGGFGTTC